MTHADTLSPGKGTKECRRQSCLQMFPQKRLFFKENTLYLQKQEEAVNMFNATQRNSPQANPNRH